MNARGGDDDDTLIAAALSGDNAAFSALMGRHKEPLYRFVRRYVGDADEAFDLVQETFVAGWSALNTFEQGRPFAVWLRRIALNKCRDWARRRRVRAFFTRAAPLEDAFDVSDDTVPADVQAADRAELARVTAAMARLPARLREALVLRTVDGLTQAEAAEVLSVSEKTIETRLYRARAKLKAQLGDRM